MPILRLNEFPEGSGSLSSDDVFLFMDDPSGSGVTKKISLSQISSAIGGGGGGPSFDAAVEWTTNHTLADGTRYLANDLVYSSGNLYRAKFDNESIPVTDTVYWENVGPGYRLNIDGRDIPNIPNPFDQNLNTFDSPIFNTIAITGSQIFGGGENSGDGNGYSTIELVPDSGLYNNHQYLIVDPTAPNHIHLRAGGTIDNSNAELIIGGENSNVKIGAGSNPQITIETAGSNTVEFLGQIDNGFGDDSGSTLHVTSIINGTITDGMTIYGDGLPVEGWVLQFGTVMAPQGSGGTGNYYLPGANYLIGSQLFNNGYAPNNTWVFGTDGNLAIPGNITLPNYTTVATGTFDNGTGGNRGISLNCVVGYELNWQGGHLKSTLNNGENTYNILCDSAMEFPGSGVDNVEINSSGLIFSDGTIQTSAALVADIVSGTGISVSSVSGVYTINATGSGLYVDQAASLVTTVFNETGSAIPKMTAVYINGGHGDRPTVGLAVASGDPTSAGTYGLTFENIDDMQLGKVIVFGALTGVNTDPAHGGIAGATEGSILYLSPTTPGGITTTKPSAPDHIVTIGTVVRVHQNQGVIEVRIVNGFELEELHNVAISGVSDNQVLMYDSTTSLWKNETLPSSSITVVSLPYSSGITTDAATGDIFDITASGSLTLNNPTNSVNGKTLRWRISQDNTGNRSVTLGNKFQIPSSASDPLPWSTSGNAMDILAATYHAGRDKWDVIAFVPGY